MTIREWKEKYGLTFPEIARKMGMRSKSAKLNVIRHARRRGGMRMKTMLKYIEISNNEITFDDLCPPKRRKAA
jgi:transcriptional regulator with XRE-family HTH domain